MKRLLPLLCAALLLAGGAHAATVTPLSYVTTPGEGQAQGGTFNYFDDGGRQLIDGKFGVNDWTANLGNGNAQEWVGWRVANPTITFTFASPVSISGLLLGMNRAEGAGIYIGINGDLNGSGFSVAANAFPNATRADVPITFAQPLVGTVFTLQLSDNNAGRWLFLDEVQFVGADGTAVVPVPGALALMLPGLALLGLAARRRGRVVA